MLREGAVGSAKAEDAGVAFRLHNEGMFGVGRPAAVRHVAYPGAGTVLGRGVPLDDRMLLVPRFAGDRVNRGPVVDDASVDRPVPGPVRVEANAGRILQSPALGQVAILGVVAIKPVTGGRGAVVPQLGEVLDLLAGLDNRIAVSILQVHQSPAAGLPGDLLGVGQPIAVVPGEVYYRIREGPALAGVQVPHLAHNLVDDPHIFFGITERVHGLVTPLHPTTRIGHAPLSLHE